MKKLIWTIFFVMIIMFSVNVNAAEEGVILPYAFENGQVADADQVNAVFNAIAKTINQNLVVMYNYGTPTGTSKVFEHTNSPTVLTSIITDATKETWSYADGSSVVYLKATSDEGTMETGRIEYSAPGIISQDLTYFPAVLGVDIIGIKAVGKIWGNAYIAKKPDGSTYGAETNMYSILGIEDVTVPAGTFLNCTKVYTVTQNYKNMAWYAEGVGMVKRIGVDGLMELKTLPK